MVFKVVLDMIFLLCLSSMLVEILVKWVYFKVIVILFLIVVVDD